MTDAIVTEEILPVRCPHCSNRIEDHGIGLVHAGPVALLFHEDPDCQKIVAGIPAYKLGL